MPETATTASRIAHLRERDANDDHVVHGVAHGADELTRGQNGWKFWPAAELQEAAPSLEGQPVYRVHGDGERDLVGEVLQAAYEADLGVVYEAAIYDDDIASELASGQREVSIEARNPSDVERHEETGAVIMRGFEYTGLATTTNRGASDANYTAPGPASENPAVAALSAAAVESALTDPGEEPKHEHGELAVGDDAWSRNLRLFRVVPPENEEHEYDDDVLGVGVSFPESGVYVDWHTSAFPDELDDPHVSEYGSIEDLRKATGNHIVDWTRTPGERSLSALAGIDSYSAGDVVSWRTGSGTLAYGKVRATIQRGEFDSVLSTDQTVTAPAVLIAVYEPGQGNEWRPKERLVARKPASITPLDNFPAAPASEGANLDVGGVVGSDDPAGARSSGRDTPGDADTNDDKSNTSTTSPMSDSDNNPGVEALLERVDEKDEQIAELESTTDDLEAELEAKETRIEELEDEQSDRIAELEGEVEDLREQNEAAREQFAAALAQADTVFDEEELAENYTLAQLSEKLEDADFTDGDGSVEPVIRSGGGSSGGQAANLSQAEQEEKQELESKLAELEEKSGPLAEKERERVEAELAELTGGEA